jgi:hypothetical protein
MAISVDWAARIVNSTASITDIVAFKDILRDLEDNEDGILHPPIITYKRLDLGGGAFFHAVDFVNGYQLRFPNAGSYEVIGNIGAAIVPVPGVFVDRIKSAAFATIAGSGSSGGLTTDQAAKLEEVWRILGLDAANPMTSTPTAQVSGSISIAVSGDGQTTSTLTRQP